MFCRSDCLPPTVIPCLSAQKHQSSQAYPLVQRMESCAIPPQRTTRDKPTCALVCPRVWFVFAPLFLSSSLTFSYALSHNAHLPCHGNNRHATARLLSGATQWNSTAGHPARLGHFNQTKPQRTSSAFAFAGPQFQRRLYHLQRQRPK